MFRFLVGLFALIGLTVIVLLVVGGFVFYDIANREPAPPESIVLTFDFERSLVEHVPSDPLAEAAFGREPSVRDVVDALERARIDPRVKGVVGRFGGDTMGLARAQELREAIRRFTATGRFAIAFSESFGEFGPGNASFYLSTAFDEIWLQPIGMVGLTGLAVQQPFAREALETLNLEPEIDRRGVYKTFPEVMTERTISEQNRAMLESLVDDLTNQLVAGIATDRDLTADAVRLLIDEGPLLDRRALEAGLVDRLGYYDEVLADAVERAGPDADDLDLLDYLDIAGRPHTEGPTIAVIYGSGTIRRGESGADPLLGDVSMGAETVVQAFDEASKDDAVRAILFRIDSGGGSAVASETIRRAVERAQRAGKPVIVSMADAAASGGYWIAMNADRIIAHPATLTGSIGVFAGKIATEQFWQDLGVNWAVVTRGRNAAMWSFVSPYDESGQERLDAMLDDIYAAFTRNVADARDLPIAGVREIAQGRVWTGNQALALGLVDELGGMGVALTRTREAAGLEAEAPVTVEIYPKPDSSFARILDLVLGRQSAGAEGMAALAQALRPIFAWAEPMLAPPGERTLRMPPVGMEP